MVKTVVGIDGMMCGMCEAHISDVIRKTFPDAKKVSASHKKGTAEFITETKPDYTVLEKAIGETGYTYKSAQSEDYVKKGLFGLL